MRVSRLLMRVTCSSSPLGMFSDVVGNSVGGVGQTVQLRQEVSGHSARPSLLGDPRVVPHIQTVPGQWLEVPGELVDSEGDPVVVVHNLRQCLHSYHADVSLYEATGAPLAVLKGPLLVAGREFHQVLLPLLRTPRTGKGGMFVILKQHQILT